MSRLLLFVFISSLYTVNIFADSYKCEINPVPKLNFSNFEKTEEAIQIRTFCKSNQTCFPNADENEYESDFKMDSIDDCIKKISEMEKGCDGLNPAEKIAIEVYTGEGYMGINQSIWKNKKSCQGLISVINQGLKKVPNYQGWVFRGATLPLKIRQQHREGAIVNYRAFTSTSSDDGWGGSDQFMIYSKTGASVDEISSNAGEKEILFATNTKFKVLRTIYDQDTDKKIYFMIEHDQTASHTKRKGDEQKALLEIKETFQQLKKIAEDFFFPFDENLLNRTRFASEDSWKCEGEGEGNLIGDNFYPKTFLEESLQSYTKSEAMAELSETIEDIKKQILFLEEMKSKDSKNFEKSQLLYARKHLKQLSKIQVKHKD